MTDGDRLLDSPEDVKLVSNEVNRCLDEAGDRLHACPREGRQSPLRVADYYLMRVQLLDRLGVRQAAVYLRKELLDAIAESRRDDDSAVLRDMGFVRGQRAITVKQPSYLRMTADIEDYGGLSDSQLWSDVMDMCEKYSLGYGYGYGYGQLAWTNTPVRYTP